MEGMYIVALFVLTTNVFAAGEGEARVCSTNVCSSKSPGLYCANQTVIHINDVMCADGDLCSHVTFHNVFSICEAQSACSADGLRFILKDCKEDMSKVKVKYTCVPESIIQNNCSSSKQKLSDPLGIITNPGYPNSPGGDIGGCYWSIKHRQSDSVIDVTVHEAMSRDFVRSSCRSTSLTISWIDCKSNMYMEKKFCHFDITNVRLQSCGEVAIRSYMYPTNIDRGNRFLVSYKVRAPGDSTTFDYLACGRFHVIPTMVPYDYDDYDIGEGISENQQTEISLVTRQKRDPYEVLDNLRLVVMCIFLSATVLAVIFALVIIIVSCKRYRRSALYDMDRKKKASSEVIMDTMKTSTTSDSVESMKCVRYKDSKPTTSNGRHHHPHYANVSTDNKATSGFAPMVQKRNYDPYASYSSIEDPEYSTVPGLDREQKKPDHGAREIKFRPEIYQNGAPADISCNVEHYTVNDDDYAVIDKTKVPHNKVNDADYDPTYDNLLVGYENTSNINRNANVVPQNSTFVRAEKVDEWEGNTC